MQLKFYQYFGCFPKDKYELPDIPLEYIVEQLDVEYSSILEYDWLDRTARRHRNEILEFLGIKKLTRADRDNLSTWLCETVFPNGATIKNSLEYVYEWLHHNKIDRPAEKQLERELISAYNQFEKELFEKLSTSIPIESIHLIDYCIEDKGETVSFSSLKSDPGRISLDTVLKEIEKLEFINHLVLPEQLLNNLSTKIKRK